MDRLIQEIVMDCPICDSMHPVEERKRLTEGVVKDEVIEYEETYYRCTSDVASEDENKFAPARVMDENLMRARDAYRRKKGLLTSTDIACIRSTYGLSQSDLAALFNWGEVTVTRYESKAIQDETYDHMMRSILENPLFALECLNKHKQRFSSEKYSRLRQRIVTRISEVEKPFLKRQEIISAYVNYDTESELNGYKQLDIPKVESILAFFVQRVNYLYKVKLMKLLWYADALSYTRANKAISGLVYQHMPLGALSLAHNEIIYLPSVDVVEEYNDDIGYRIVPRQGQHLTSFTTDEIDVLETIAKKFREVKSREIINYMHLERAYYETEPYQIIPFSLCKELRELK